MKRTCKWCNTDDAPLVLSHKMLPGERYWHHANEHQCVKILRRENEKLTEERLGLIHVEHDLRAQVERLERALIKAYPVLLANGNAPAMDPTRPEIMADVIIDDREQYHARLAAAEKLAQSGEELRFAILECSFYTNPEDGSPDCVCGDCFGDNPAPGGQSEDCVELRSKYREWIIARDAYRNAGKGE